MHIIHNLAALLGKDDNSPVTEGATLKIVAGGYAVRLLRSLPDEDGLVTVQAFPQRVTPGDVGLYFRPASVSLDLTEEEATPIVEYYRRLAAGETPPDFPRPPEAHPAASGLGYPNHRP